jgi:hypothetical protein
MPDRALAAGREQRELDLKRGAERDAALASGLIADILQARGQLDEALKIRNEEQLPVYERLGDVHARALTMGRIAGILQARGDLDGSLRIRREQELPVYERLGDARFLLFGRWNLASTLLRRGREQDREEARGLLVVALDEARRLKLPEALQIEQLLEQARLARLATSGIRSTKAAAD